MKTKKVLLQIISLLFITTAIVTSTVAFALHKTASPESICEEIVQNYDPDKPALTKETAALTKNKKIDCKNDHYGNFPTQHKSDKLKDHQKADDTYHEPYTKHEHRFINLSEEEYFKDAEKYIFKWTYIDTFEIQLENDFQKNIIISTLNCDISDDGEKICNEDGDLGIGPDGKLVKYFVQYYPKENVIRWFFPGKKGNPNYDIKGNQDWSKLLLTGKNPTLDKAYGISKESKKSSLKESMRSIKAWITFSSKDLEEEFWSATTTSRALVQNIYMEIPKSLVDKKDKTAISNYPEKIYKHTTAADAPSANFYWFPIGTTTTIWNREVAPPPPPEVNKCTALEASLQQTYETQLGTAHILNINKLTFGPKDEKPQGLKAKWSAKDNDTFFLPPNNFGANKKGEIEVPYNQPVAFIGEGPVNVKLSGEGLTNEILNPELCKDSINIPQNKCDDLEVVVDEETVKVKNNKIDLQNSPGSTTKYLKFLEPQLKYSMTIPPNAQIKWNTTDLNGIFYKFSPITYQIEAVGKLTTQPFYQFMAYEGVGKITAQVVGTDIPACKFEKEFKNICEDLKASLDESKTLSINGNKAYNLNIDLLKFSAETPASAKIQWTANDINGTFYKITEYNLQKLGTYKAVTNPQTEVYYLPGIKQLNELVIDVKLIEPAGADPLNKCVDKVKLNKCNLLTLEKGAKVKTSDDQDATSFKVQVDFTKTMPADTQYVWAATDGQFYIKNSPQGQFVPAGKNVTTGILTEVAYVGFGNVTVKVKGFEDACNASVAFEKPPEKLLCKELKVNHHQKIITGKANKFNATAFNDKYGIFNGKITYSVPAGYGKFYTSKPDMIQVNDSTTVEEFNPASFDFTPPEIGFCQAEADIKLSFDAAGTWVKKMIIEQAKIQVSDSEISKEVFDWLNGNFNIENVKKIKYDGKFGVSPVPTPNFPSAKSPQFKKGIEKPKNFNSVFDIPQLPIDKETLDKVKNIKPVKKFGPQAQQSGETITVDPGTEVYFIPYKSGTDVITVSTNCTGVWGCSRTFSIEKPLACEAITLTSRDKNADLEQCLKDGFHVFEAKFFQDKAKTIPFEDKIKVKWTTTDPEGKFSLPFQYYQGDPVKHAENFMEIDNGVIAPPIIFYNGGGRISAAIHTFNNFPISSQFCKADVKPCGEEKNRCVNLEIKSDQKEPLSAKEINAGQLPKLSIETKDLFGNPLNQKTDILWSNDANGEFVSQVIQPGETLTLPIEFFTPPEFNLYFSKKSTGEVTKGKIYAQMANPKDPLFADICKDEIRIEEIREEKPERPEVRPEERPEIRPEERPEIICRDLTVKIKEYGLDRQTDELAPGQVYIVNSAASFTGPNPDAQITYSIDRDYGIFINEEYHSPILLNFFNLVRDNLDIRFIENINNKLAKPLKLTNEVTIRPGQNLILITFNDAPETNNSALKIKVENTKVRDCRKEFPVIVPLERIERRELVCENLFLTTEDDKFDPAQPLQFVHIRGNYENHQGTITVTIVGGVIAKQKTPLSTNDFKEELLFTTSEIRNSNNDLIIVYKKLNDFDPAKTVNISAVANGAARICSDDISTQPVTPPPTEFECIDLDIVKPTEPWIVENNDDDEVFQIEVDTNPANKTDEFFYHWEVTDGAGKWSNNQDKKVEKGKLLQILADFDKETEVEVWAAKSENGTKIAACKDLIEAEKEKEEDKKPTIEKVVYPENNVEDFDDFISIASDYDYLTYVAIFTPGSAKSVKINENEMFNGIIDGNLGGELEFKGMKINVIENSEASNEKKYGIFQTKDYEVDDSDDLLGDEDYEIDDDLQFADEDDIDDEDFDDTFEEEFDCDLNPNKFCIEGDKNFTDVVEDFTDGKAIEFQNLDKLKADSAIIIKYQMTLETAINDDKCKDMSVESGCGEKFHNEIAFEAFKEAVPDEDKGPDFENDAEAKAVILCPFIIKRQGGETFFVEEIDLGIDISMCAEVKGDEGVVIIPEEEEEAKIVKTGQGGDELIENLKPILEIPSHDVCRFSNSDKNIEGYNNVLKNFSSTICELRAEVAEVWQEKYIKSSIDKNIKAVSAWNTNLNNQNSTLFSLPESKNGIYVKTNGSLTLALNEKLKGAKTIIVKNGDLKITRDLIYDENVDYSNPKNIPSAAFIVINGNIEIDDEVGEIDGAFIAIDLNGSGKGKIKAISNETTKKLLVVRGNLIGDVYELFKNRTGVGDPKKNQGSITIYFDQAMILNPPPGLGQLIEVNQLKSVK